MKKLKLKNKFYTSTVFVVAGLIALSIFTSQKEKPTIDSLSWTTYTNSTYHFSIKIPSNFEYYASDDVATPTLTNILFYDDALNGKDHIVSSAPNPLLVLIENNAKYIKLDVNGNSFVSRSDFNIKNFINKSLGGPHGDVQQNLLQWESFTSDDGKTVMYFYTTKLVTKENINRQGVVWLSYGTLYTLEDEINDFSFIKAVAKTFVVN